MKQKKESRRISFLAKPTPRIRKCKEYEDRHHRISFLGRVPKKNKMRQTPLKRKTPLRSHTQLKAHKGLNQTSKKRKRLVPKLADLYTKLRRLCHNRSELSGRRPDWRSDGFVEPHHIGGRNGEHLLNPFEIIMLTADEHDIETDHKPGCHTKTELLNIIRPTRLKQGFGEEE